MMNRQFILLVKYARHLILMGCFLKKEDGQLHNKLKKLKIEHVKCPERLQRMTRQDYTISFNHINIP